MKQLSKVLTLLFFFLLSPLAWGVDINTADAATMAVELKGVGEKRAQAIVQYRQEHGPFKTVDELVKVKGIGPAVLDKNRENLTASNPSK